MTSYGRRGFLLRTAAAALALREAVLAATQAGMRLGLIVSVGNDPERAIARVHDLGFPTCQASVADFGDAMVRGLRVALERHRVEATAINTSGPGPQVYDFYQGPQTIGVVPRRYRRERIDRLKRSSDFAKKLGIPAIHTHCGFIPEDPNDPLYQETVDAIREVVGHCRANGQTFLYETGQETPITLLRTILDVGLDNQGVNLDTANLILYGKGHPVDALDVIGRYVRGLHAKDGLFPTDPKKLGREVPIGEGKADFPRIIARLKQLDYRGPITIEREISGPKQIEDIRKAKEYLEKLMA